MSVTSKQNFYIRNKKALYNYHILDHLEAGIVLTGAEVRSIREGRIDLSESFVRVLNNEAFLINANIPKPMEVASDNYEVTRSRKLLLHRDQINSLIGKTSGSKNALIPIAIYEKNNRFKLEIGLAKSKKEFDKRKSIKEKDHIRRIEQELRGKE